jgi:hypothetical protein
MGRGMRERSTRFELKNKCLYRTIARILVGVAPSTLLVFPLSCGDNSNGNPSDASPDTQVDSPSGGPSADATIEADAARGDAPADGQVVVEGGPGMDVAADDQSADGGGPQCPPLADPTKAQACLVLAPEVLNVEVSNTFLDGKGQLIIQVFDTATPDVAAQPIVPAILYPAPSDAGPQESDVYSLPVIAIDGLPSTVYIRTYFIDNPLWLQTKTGLTFGMFIGGMDLSGGVGSPPPLQQVSLTAGQSTIVTQKLTALRRFQTRVVLGLSPDGGPGQPAGNGQGPLSVNVYEQATPSPAIYGTAQYPCVDIVSQPSFSVTGFFYNGAANTVSSWFYGQLDDFGLGGSSPAGALVSLAAGGTTIPDSQKVDVAADKYDVLLGDLPQITLSTILPNAPSTDTRSCGSSGGGSDAGPDGGTDAPPG